MKGAKEFTGRSLDEAIEAACNYYDLPREKLEIEIINDAKSGIFGLVGAKKATVLAKQASMANYADLSVSNEKDHKAQEATEKPKAERSQSRQRPSRGQAREHAPGADRHPGRNDDRASQPSTDAAGETASAGGALATAAGKSDAVRSASSSRNPEKSAERTDERDGRGRSRSVNSRPRSRSSERQEPRDGERGRSERSSHRDGRRNDRRSGGKPDHVQAFEAELPLEQNSPDGSDEHLDSFEFAMDFETQTNLKGFDEIDQDKALELVQSSLEQLLKPICSAPEIKVAIENGRIEASVHCEDESGLIIGREGQTLAALQYMVSRIISRQMEAAIHVHLDTGDYKERQDQKLKELALRLAERARESGRTQYTRPLSSYHRRIVHMVLQTEENIETRSRGDGAMKRVYIFMRQEKS